MFLILKEKVMNHIAMIKQIQAHSKINNLKHFMSINIYKVAKAFYWIFH